MNTIIEEIRKRIEARKKNTYHVGDYDEYADGIVVGLSYALGIIDEVEKEHPVPAEEGKILPKLREFLATATPEELEAKYRELEYLLAPKDENADIEREMQEIAERAPSDFCHYSDIVDREEWCKEKFRHFFAAGMLAERERLMKEAVEGEIVKDISGKLGATAKVNLDGFKFGEKVRVIIIKSK